MLDTVGFPTPNDTSVEKKFDYNFAPTTWFPSSYADTSCVTQADRSTTAYYSDHCYTAGTFLN